MEHQGGRIQARDAARETGRGPPHGGIKNLRLESEGLVQSMAAGMGMVREVAGPVRRAS
jgi:hypothetical protein